MNESTAPEARQCSAQPVAEIDRDGVLWLNTNPHRLPIGTKLYAGEAPKEKQEWPISCWCCGSPNWPKGSGGIEHAGVADPVAWWRLAVYEGCLPVITSNPEDAQQWREEGHEVRELCFVGPNKGKNFPPDDRG